jgi:pyrroloquinoline quinone biosynthesis protein B
VPVRFHILGTAQDGGVPHPGCECERCEAARSDRGKRRRASCAAIEGETGKTFLLEATPDFRAQAHALARATGRPPLAVDAIAITHAHIGHYLGLAFLGEEALHTTGMPVYGTPSVLRFLKGNRPWSRLVERGEVELRTIVPGRGHPFDGCLLHAFLTPHRGADTDTVGFEIRGPNRTLVYVTDADVFPPEIVERIKDADVAVVDGTFYSPAELPHRDILAVRHPFVRDTVQRLAGARGDVHFTHLNHTNPLVDPASVEAASLPPRFHVARDGDVFEL